jgi:hypothetical protein
MDEFVDLGLKITLAAGVERGSESAGLSHRTTVYMLSQGENRENRLQLRCGIGETTCLAPCSDVLER